MRAQTTVSLRFSSKKKLRSLFKALKPETDTHTTKRAEAFLKMEEDLLLLTIWANDATALRATINTYLRLIDSTIKILNYISEIPITKTDRNEQNFD